MHGLVPFWHPPDDPYFSQKVRALYKTVALLKNVVNEVWVILDGVDIAVPNADKVIRIKEHAGKAAAIRWGLTIMLRTSNVQGIIQCDADLDQNPEDACLLAKRFEQYSATDNLPVLIIGDRYPDVNWLHAFSKAKGIPWYRRFVLWTTRTLCGHYGLNVRDCVSGFRMFNRRYAEDFLRLSWSNNYGLETEMVVIAFEIGAVVDSVILSYSRPRDKFTRAGKVGQNLSAILSHQRGVFARNGFFSRISFWFYRRLQRSLLVNPQKKASLYVLPLVGLCVIQALYDLLFYCLGYFVLAPYPVYKQRIVWDRSPLGDNIIQFMTLTCFLFVAYYATPLLYFIIHPDRFLPVVSWVYSVPQYLPAN